MIEFPKDFYNLAEKKQFLEYILYGDTDSIFFKIPIDCENMSIEERLEIANKAAKDINNIIKEYVEGYLLPKMNIDISNNQTDFKTELLIDSIMFIDVKKNYAYKLLAKENKVFEKPSFKYTGLQVIKSDTAKLTQDMLRDIIEKVALNTEILDNKQRIKKVIEIVNKYKQIFDEDCNNLIAERIGKPGKWSKQDLFINGMKLYNYIMGEDTFSSGSAGKFVYCNFLQIQKMKAANINLDKINGIVFPYTYDTEKVAEKFNEYRITINRTQQWDTLFTTSIQRVIEVIKNIADSGDE